MAGAARVTRRIGRTMYAKACPVRPSRERGTNLYITLRGGMMSRRQRRKRALSVGVCSMQSSIRAPFELRFALSHSSIEMGRPSPTVGAAVTGSYELQLGGK